MHKLNIEGNYCGKLISKATVTLTANHEIRSLLEKEIDLNMSAFITLIENTTWRYVCVRLGT